MKGILKDTRHALRILGKNPGFAVLAILTLGLGIGASGTMSSFVNGILLRPLPYDRPEEIVMVWSRWQDFPKTWVSLPECQLYRQEARGFADIGLFSTAAFNLTGGGEPERIAGAYVTANLFPVLGTAPLLGRTFTGEEALAKSDVVIVSERLWRRRFGGAREIGGQSLEIDGVSKTIVGVMPSDFKLPLDFSSATPSEVWLPLAERLDAPASMPYAGGEHTFYAVGRLRSGVGAEQAASELRAISDRLTKQGIYPESWHFEPLVIPIADDVFGVLRSALIVLTIAVAFIVLIACANVANLLLSQGNHRLKELSVRMAFGADRRRLVRQLLTESVVLAVFGGALGLWLTYLAIQACLALNAGNVPRLQEVALDGDVVTFTVLISLATAVFCGLIPAFQLSGGGLHGRLQEGGRTTGMSVGRRRFQSFLVATEVASAVVLVIGAGLMMRTFWKLTRVDPGFRSQGVLTLRLAPSEAKYPLPELITGYYEELLFRVQGLPEVQSVAAVRLLPLASEIGNWGLEVEGYEPPAGDMARGDWQVVTPGYFETLGIPLKAGRFFTEADRLESEPVIIVSESMARKFWKNGDPIGRRIRVLGAPDSPMSTVVGVVGDVRHNGITAEMRETWYLPHSQFHASTGFTTSEMTLVVKTASSPQALISPLREEILAIDPNVPVFDVRTLDEILSNSVAQPRLTMSFLIVFAALALILAVIGVYGVVRYTVGIRKQEIGLRMALGAQAKQLVGLVLRQSMTVVGTGVLVGLLASAGLTRYMASLLYEVEAYDVLTFLLVAGLLLLAALVASYLPASRAAAIDPMAVLRRD
jgi:predicted permease